MIRLFCVCLLLFITISDVFAVTKKPAKPTGVKIVIIR